VEYIPSMGMIRDAYKVSVGKFRKMRQHGRHKHINERIILKQILKKYGMRAWTGFNWFRIGSTGGLL